VEVHLLLVLLEMAMGSSYLHPWSKGHLALVLVYHHHPPLLPIYYTSDLQLPPQERHDQPLVYGLVDSSHLQHKFEHLPN
jgi:hypothetical protein